MKKIFCSTIIGFAGLAISVTTANALTITAFDNATDMAQEVGGKGIVVNSASFMGQSSQAGYFSGGSAAGIGMESGVVLSTGKVDSLQGDSNTSGGTSSVLGGNGYAPLTALTIAPSYDAAVLSVDFSIAGGMGGDAKFEFVFGSEEYNEFVGSNFNDVFAFFLDGTDAEDNVARVPGSNDFISINNVNNGKNSSFYNDNTNGGFAFELDGFTDVFTISLLGLSAGNHTLTMAIADTSDRQLDSAIFIKGESLSTPSEVPEPATMALFGLGLAGFVGFSRYRKQKN